MICSKCKGLINVERDEFYSITLFKKSEIDSEIFMHRQCYKDLQKDRLKGEINKKLKQVAPLMKGILKGGKK